MYSCQLLMWLPVTTVPETIEQYIRQTSKYQWAAQTLTHTQWVPTAIAAIKHHSLMAVSDSSFKDQLGTSASMLHDGDIRHSICSMNAVPGPSQIQSAFRSKLAGILGSLVIIQALCTVGKVDNGSVTIGLDGQQAMNYAAQWHLPPSSTPSFDLIHAIHDLKRNLPISLKWHWVKGHQDDTKSKHDLDIWSQTNILVDAKAKSYLNTLKRQQFQPRPLQLTTGWNLRMGNELLAHFDMDRVYPHVWSMCISQYWKQKQDWHEETHHFVDWDSIGQALKSAPFHRQRHHIKVASTQLAIGRQLHRRDNQLSDQCPICRVTEETTDHLFKCTAPSVQQLWNQAMLDLRQYLEHINTDDGITDAILEGLNRWHQGEPHPICTTGPVPLWDAINQQTDIGWGAGLKGFVSLQWGSYHAQLSEPTDKYGSSHRWTVALIRKLWDVSWDFWQQRNALLHATEVNQHDALTQQIVEQFRLGHETLISDHWILDHSLDEVLQWPTTTQWQWLRSVRAARGAHSNEYQRSQRQLRLQRTAFRRWLRTGSLGHITRRPTP